MNDGVLQFLEKEGFEDQAMLDINRILNGVYFYEQAFEIEFVPIEETKGYEKESSHLICPPIIMQNLHLPILGK